MGPGCHGFFFQSLYFDKSSLQLIFSTSHPGHASYTFRASQGSVPPSGAHSRLPAARQLSMGPAAGLGESSQWRCPLMDAKVFALTDTEVPSQSEIHHPQQILASPLIRASTAAPARSKQVQLGEKCPIIPGRLAFAITDGDTRTRKLIHDNPEIFYFSSDFQERYEPYCAGAAEALLLHGALRTFIVCALQPLTMYWLIWTSFPRNDSFDADFGPVNLGIVHAFCAFMDMYLNLPQLSEREIVYYMVPPPSYPLNPVHFPHSLAWFNKAEQVNTLVLLLPQDEREEFRTNGAFLLASYMVIKHGWTPDEAWAPFARLQPGGDLFLAFRDATYLPQEYFLSVHACIKVQPPPLHSLPVLLPPPPSGAPAVLQQAAL